MVNETISDEASLLERLADDVRSCGKERIILLAGNFPLIYTEDHAVEATCQWGEFSTYTLELACRIGQKALNDSKGVRFVFFVDDHFYENTNVLTCRRRRTLRKWLYKERSGPHAQLPQEFCSIMARHGFDETRIMRQDQGKMGRRDCLYFSEKLLRASQRNIKNPCAREYIEFLENPKYIDKARDHIVSFVPDRCSSNICNGILETHVQGLSASHIFMQTDLGFLEALGGGAKHLTRDDMYREGVQYRRDLPHNTPQQDL